MANVLFKKGLLANLPKNYAAGTFYVTTDERAMYLDIDDSTRIRLGDFIEVAAVANLPTEGASTTALYYCIAENILAKWNGIEWKQINPDTGATSVESVGDGNAVTTASYNAETRTLTLTKGTTFALPTDISNAVGELGNDTDGKAYANVKAYVDAKTTGIATDATVAGKVDKVEGYSLVANTEIARLAEMSDDANKVEDSDTNGNIKIDGEEVTVYDDKFHNGIKTVNALGGIGANTSLDNMTTHQILEALLFPYVAPSITKTSRTTAAATLENGAEQTLSSCSITVAKKSKAITKIALYNGATELGVKEGAEVANGGTFTFNGFDAITVSMSNNPNLKFVVDDESKASAATANVGVSTFVYPYYWGVCAKGATVDEALVEGLTKSVQSKNNSQAVTYDCDNQCMVFAYPKGYGALVSILDPNNFETLGDYTRSEVSITGLDGTAQNYYVYVSGAGSATGFKVTFKIVK